MKFVTPKNGTRNTVNGSSTEFAGRISVVISKPAAAPIAISADAIVSRHIAVLLFRHSYSSSDTSTINTALTQNLPALACKEMSPDDFSGILTRGGTILGTKRQPFKMMKVIGDDNVDKVKNMKKTYQDQKLDCLLTLGGNGTHKTSKLLADEGLNVIGLPKTIDNDIFGTDVTFGFHTAVDIATDALDRLHTTANSHSRILLCEIMGNKAGWLTLSAGIAGGADIILIPEIPYDIDKVCKSVQKRSESGKNFSIVAVAEGCFDKEEAKMKKKERTRLRQEAGITTATNRIAAQIQQKTGLEARVCVPGHMLRGGSPSAYDRVLATQFGVYAAELIREEHYGMSVAKVGGTITANKLDDIAGKTKFVSPDDQLVQTARNLGISFGD